MDNDLSTKTVLVVDDGAQSHFALRLAREFGRVLYYREYKEDEPTSIKLGIGCGYPEVERVPHLFDAVEKADIIAFPGIYRGDMQVYLEQNGKRVWGSRKAEAYEYNRKLFMETLERIGLETPPWKAITGTTELRRFCMENEDYWIKGSMRGDFETFHHRNYVLTQQKLDTLDVYYGGLRDDIPFVAVKNIESKIEDGFDGLIIADPEGRPLYPDIGFVTYETKNLAAIAAAVDYKDLPENVRAINDAFCPVMCERFARTHFGTEIKETEDDKSYFLDATLRNSQPPFEIIGECVENIGESIWHGSIGEQVPMKVVAKYGVQVMLYSAFAGGNHLPVLISEKSRPWTKLFGSYLKDGVDYCPPHEVEGPRFAGREEIGCIVGIGDDLESAYEHLKENVEGVEGFDTQEQRDALEECLNRAKSGEEMGIPFGKEPVPDPEIVGDES